MREPFRRKRAGATENWKLKTNSFAFQIMPLTPLASRYCRQNRGKVIIPLPQGEGVYPVKMPASHKFRVTADTASFSIRS